MFARVVASVLAFSDETHAEAFVQETHPTTCEGGVVSCLTRCSSAVAVVLAEKLHLCTVHDSDTKLAHYLLSAHVMMRLLFSEHAPRSVVSCYSVREKVSCILVNSHALETIWTEKS